MIVAETVDALAAFEPVPLPVLSLYLDTTPGGDGRPTFGPYLRREFADRLRGYALTADASASLDADLERITSYIDAKLESRTRGLAIFACAGAGLFEAVQIEAPFPAHQLVVSDRPHLYPLARLDDQWPRYAAVLVDTHRARVFVFATGRRSHTADVEGQKTKQVKVGGWSQARYQRHVQNFHQQHVKEVADVLARVVDAEQIAQIVILGDANLVPKLRAELPKAIDEKVVDVMPFDRHEPDDEVLARTLETVRASDAEADQAVVEELLGEYRRGGLAVVGAAATQAALLMGQVDRLVIAADPAAIDVSSVGPTGRGPVEHTGSAALGLDVVDGAAAQASEDDASRQAATVGTDERVADELVRLARQTDAAVRFIEDAALVAPAGGVGAFLRFDLSSSDGPARETSRGEPTT
jgi:peptide chain release factor subunit 1